MNKDHVIMDDTIDILPKYCCQC